MKPSLLLLGAAALAAATGPKSAITFTNDVAPIVFNNCTGCHRPGQAAPFTFMNYDGCEEARRARRRGHEIALHAALACGARLRRIYG